MKVVYRGVEVANLNLASVLTKNIVVIISELHDSAIAEAIGELKKEANAGLHIYDFYGFWSRLRDLGDIPSLLMGIDIKINPFEPPSHVPTSTYLDLLEQSFSIALSAFNYNPNIWRCVFRESLYTALKREGSINVVSFLSTLEELKNESTGTDKQAYSILLSLIKETFPEEDRRLFEVSTNVDYPSLPPKLIIDLSSIKSIRLRTFTYVLFLLLNLCVRRRNVQHHFVCNADIFLGNRGEHANIMLEIFDEATIYNNKLILQCRDWSILHRLSVDSIVVASKYLTLARLSRNFLSAIPLEEFSTHYVISDGEILPVRVELSDLKLAEGADRALSEGQPSKEPIEEELKLNVLRKIKDLGEATFDGLYIYFQQYPKSAIYSTLESLWREGLVKKVVEARRTVYRLTLKGLYRTGGKDEGR